MPIKEVVRLFFALLILVLLAARVARVAAMEVQKMMNQATRIPIVVNVADLLEAVFAQTVHVAVEAAAVEAAAAEAAAVAAVEAAAEAAVEAAVEAVVEAAVEAAAVTAIKEQLLNKMLMQVDAALNRTPQNAFQRKKRYPFDRLY